jgi:hypothetical protein
MGLKYKILITDDQTILRAGLRALLSADPDLEVVGEADDGRDAVRLAVTLAWLAHDGPRQSPHRIALASRCRHRF